MNIGNLLDDCTPPATGERFDVLLRRRQLVVERIVSSASPEGSEYRQPQDEWVLLVHGSAMLDVAGEARELNAGDHVFLPAGTPHRVLRTSDGALWLAVHLHPDATGPVGTGHANAVRMFEPALHNRSMPEASVIPVLHYPDVPAAVQWLARTFGFRERQRIGNHRVQMQAGAGAFVVAQGAAAGQGASTMVRVADVDAHHAAALLAGATVIGAPQSFPYGERQYSAQDPGGHVWTFSQTEADVDPVTWGGTLVDAPAGPTGG